MNRGAALADAPRDDTLVFAHLTDPHLTSLDGVPAPLRDKRLLGWLSWHRRRRHRHLPDILARIVTDIDAEGIEQRVVTGDLTQIGLASELAAARSWLERLGDSDRVTLVPGNHDLYVADRSRAMHEHWAPWMCSDDGDRGFPFLRLRGAVAFIGLDSAAPSPPLLATGRLGRRQLEALRDLLQRTAAAGYARVVLIHHAPLPGGDPWRKRLIDAGDLTVILRECGAELVLHGHGHEGRVDHLRTPRGPVPVVQGPSASAASEGDRHRAAWMHCSIQAEAGHFRVRVTPRRPGLEALEPHCFELPRGG
jgi:3',5'-cyclic AMP phosphodiesterase CpdA